MALQDTNANAYICLMRRYVRAGYCIISCLDILCCLKYLKFLVQICRLNIINFPWYFLELKYNYTLNHIFRIKCFHIFYLFEGSFILAFDFACFFLHNNANHKVFGNRYYHRKLENEQCILADVGGKHVQRCQAYVCRSIKYVVLCLS